MDSLNDAGTTATAGQGWQSNTTWAAADAIASNATLGVINEFKVQAANSVRSSTIILASFNTVSAFATVVGILFDCYLVAKRQRGREKPVDVTTWSCIQETEAYPLILSLGIMIQGIIFAVSQSQGMEGLFQDGCTIISAFMWPAVLLVPYIQVVLGLEVTIRGLRSDPFPTRSRWNVAICIATVAALVIATTLVGVLIPASDICFPTFLWFISEWAEGAFGVFLFAAVALSVCTVIIPIRLTRFSLIQEIQRVSASRMVYYLVAAVLSNAFMVPYFFGLTFSAPSYGQGDDGMVLDMIAMVVVNISGIVTGGLYLLLRRSRLPTINPKDKLPDSERQRLKHKIRKPSHLDFNEQLAQPVTGPIPYGRDSKEDLWPDEKKRDEFNRAFNLSPSSQSPEPPNPLGSNAAMAPLANPRMPEPAQFVYTPYNQNARRPSTSYSIFPNEKSKRPSSQQPPAAYSPTDEDQETLYQDTFGMLMPPPLITPGNQGKHQRNSSVGSSATVQIGLRFSNLKDMPIEDPRKVSTDSRVGVPNLAPPPVPAIPAAAYQRSPLAISMAQAVTSPPPSRSTPSPTNPMDNVTTLSPTVYEPQSPAKSVRSASSASTSRSKTPSPKGVGFQMPQRVNTGGTEPTDSLRKQPSLRRT